MPMLIPGWPINFRHLFLQLAECLYIIKRFELQQIRFNVIKRFQGGG